MSIVEETRGGPSMRRGKSKQDYGTPTEFIHAVEARFGPIVCDLAATAENTKAKDWIDPVENSLSRPWAELFPRGNLWLNPPFANIAPWAEKCALESARRHGIIFLLTPASIGTDWFAEHVNRKAMVLGLSPRIPFDGMPVNPQSGKVDGYPKDLMLSLFAPGFNGFDCWRWKQ